MLPSSLLCLGISIRELIYRGEFLLNLPTSPSATILGYHLFSKDAKLSVPNKILSVDWGHLVEHCLTIQSKVTIAPVSEVLNNFLPTKASEQCSLQTKSSKTENRNWVGITIDDVLSTNLIPIIDILLHHKLPATLFLISNTLLQSSVRLSLSLRKQMQSVGIEVGSHSFSHQDLTTMPRMEFQQEIAESRKLIEDHLDLECKMFSYPYGMHNRSTMSAVASAGYSWGLTCVSGRLCCNEWGNYNVPRVEIVRWDSEATVLAKTQGQSDKSMMLWRQIQKFRN